MHSPDLVPGQPADLFAGDAELLAGDPGVSVPVAASVRVWFDWHVGLRVEAVADDVPDRMLFDDGPVAVRLQAGRFDVPGFSSRGRLGEGRVALSGALSRALVGDETALLDRVEFGLANMPTVSLFDDALDVESNGWSVRIVKVDDYDDRVAEVRASGGGAVTHRAVLRRTDDEAFVWADASEVLDALRWVATFVTGTRVPVMFPVGIVGEAQVRVQEWGNVRRSRFGGVLSWCGDFQRPNAVRALFPMVLDAWRKTARRRNLTVALEFWLDAQLGAVIETRLVSAVAGLELMAWEWLVDVDGRDPYVVDHRKSTDQRFRSMLELIGVPVEVPTHMTDVAATWPGQDGPKTVADLRHRVVHPKGLDALFDVPHGGRHDALRLATWYLELSLLRRLGYEGRYIAQVAPLPIFAGTGEPVPWASDSAGK
ncbi:MAG: hypothetical protein WD942_03785 [Dehalococcoidia bacterium]